MLSKAFDPQLGGRDFTERLVTHFKKEFSKRYKLTTLDKPRPTLRLFNECEKLKKNLSANTTKIPVNIDCLAEDRDVSGRMDRYCSMLEHSSQFLLTHTHTHTLSLTHTHTHTHPSLLCRGEFIELCGDLLARVRAPLEAALAKSGEPHHLRVVQFQFPVHCTTGLRIEDIEAVEIVGGSCRVPAIKDIIADVFKRDLSTTLNMDEAVARGCALQVSVCVVCVCEGVRVCFPAVCHAVTNIQSEGLQYLRYPAIPHQTPVADLH